MNRIHAGTHIVAMRPIRIVRRRRELQAYYGSARSDGSRLPFLLKPSGAANAFCLYGFIANTCRLRCGGIGLVIAQFTPHMKRTTLFNRINMRLFARGETTCMKAFFYMTHSNGHALISYAVSL